jgi:hypothetical protein
VVEETPSMMFFGLKRISVLMTLCTQLWAGEEISSAPNLIRVKTNPHFSGASVPNALTFACFKRNDEAEAFFSQMKLPFEKRMLREIDGQKCHLFYTPTITGFRADPDNKPITELFFDVQSLRLLTKTERIIGDPLDMVKSLLAVIERPVQIHIGTNRLHAEEFYQAAIKFYFKNSPHKIVLRNSHTDADNWPQDYLKSGSTQGQRKILVPYRLYEGKPDYGELHKPLLDTFSEPWFVRSKLSWEGGDIQVVLDPKNARKTILFYGRSAKVYWGMDLTEDEYAYILKLEFGADRTVDVSDLAPHADYFVSFIPKENIALVAEPLTRNYAVACGAAGRLLEFIGKKTPAPVELVSLKNLLSSEGQPFVLPETLEHQLQKAVKEVQDNEEAWTAHEDKQLQERLATYLRLKCGDDSQCVAKLYSPPEGQREILKDDINLLRDCNDAYLISKSNESLLKIYLAIIESQLSEPRPELQKRINDKVQEIQDLGFRVIRVPQIGADSTIAWSGISYVNNLLVDYLLFLPKFGLGAVEDEIFDRLQKQLPIPYRIIPVFSQNSIVYNGGIHCRVGIVR